MDNKTITFHMRLRMLNQDYPYYGSTEICDNVILKSGWYVIDTEGKNIRLHDGVTLGGIEIPNINKIRSMIASGADSSIFVGTLAQVLAATTVTPGDIGVATDTHGVLVRDTNGKWGGNLGTATSVTAIDTSSLADGSTLCANLGNGNVTFKLKSGSWTTNEIVSFDTIALLSAYAGSFVGFYATALDRPGSMLQKTVAGWIGNFGVFASESELQTLVPIAASGCTATLESGSIYVFGNS